MEYIWLIEIWKLQQVIDCLYILRISKEKFTFSYFYDLYFA